MFPCWRVFAWFCLVLIPSAAFSAAAAMVPAGTTLEVRLEEPDQLLLDAQGNENLLSC